MAIDAGGRRNGSPVSEPNVVPFIDVMLVLLIVFMVTAPTPTVDLRVNLPAKGHLTPGRNPTIVHIIDHAGQAGFAVDGQPTTLAGLSRTVLQHALANNSTLDRNEVFAEANIFIQPDQSLAYGQVVDVMSLLQEGGFAKVGIYAERTET